MLITAQEDNEYRCKKYTKVKEMKDKSLYIVIYTNWDCHYRILGVFTDEKKALKCFDYEKKVSNLNHDYSNGGMVKIEKVECSDDIDFEAKIFELEETERQKKIAGEEAIKQKDLIEFNRIKEKYGL